MEKRSRSFRVSEQLWQAAKMKGARQGVSISQVIIWALEAYVGQPPVVLPRNPFLSQPVAESPAAAEPSWAPVEDKELNVFQEEGRIPPAACSHPSAFAQDDGTCGMCGADLVE